MAPSALPNLATVEVSPDTVLLTLPTWQFLPRTDISLDLKYKGH